MKLKDLERNIAAGCPGLRQDAGETAFFARQLEWIRPQPFDVEFAPLKARMFLPVNNQIPTGAELYTYQIYEQIGRAKITRDYADDAPRADLRGREASQVLRAVTSSYGYSIQEIRSAMMANLNLDARKANAAREAVERKFDDILLLGDPDFQLNGLFSFTKGGVGNPLSFPDPTGTWDTLTPDEVLAQLHGIASLIVTNSNEVEVPDTILLPIDRYNLIANTRMGVSSDTTILTQFLRTSPYITDVMMSHKLATAGAGGTRRMVCYKRDPSKLEALIPQEFEQLAPQQKDYQIVTPCHSRIGGVVLYYPKSMAYGDAI